MEGSEKKLASRSGDRGDLPAQRPRAAAGRGFREPQSGGDARDAIGKGGRDAFYKGPIARAIVADMRSATACSKSATSPSTRPTGSIRSRRTYRGYDVYEMPPNTQGFLVLEMLNILEGFDIKSMGHNSAGLSACAGRGEADRVRGSRGVSRPIRNRFRLPLLKTLISKEYATLRRKEIDPNRAAEAIQGRRDHQAVDRCTMRRSELAPRSEQDQNFTGTRSRRHDLHDGCRRQGQLHLARFSRFIPTSDRASSPATPASCCTTGDSGFNLTRRSSGSDRARTSGRCTP